MRDWGDTFLCLAISLIAGSAAIVLTLAALTALIATFTSHFLFVLLFLFLGGLSMLMWTTTVGAFSDMLDS